eukprot:XP_001708711.1 Hypothetical protein GL50803_106115 [Giardia lamblia ATCC 50803]
MGVHRMVTPIHSAHLAVIIVYAIVGKSLHVSTFLLEHHVVSCAAAEHALHSSALAYIFINSKLE